MAALETSLRSERQQNDAIMKQLAESQGEIGELQRKLEDADARNGLLQDSLQRFHYYLVSISSVCRYSLSLYFVPIGLDMKKIWQHWKLR
jgi:septal ring factor EnvC (AmiA/AmiB activator)